MSRQDTEFSPISEDFLKENKANLCQSVPKSHKPGPYTKSKKEIRRNEVFRLHFEYGYSARKIADLMKISRNTINGDIDFLYGITVKNYDLINPQTAVIKQLTKLEIQKTRLRESLDKTQNFSEKISIERLLFDIDSKIIHVRIKISESHYRVHELATNWLNRHMQKSDVMGSYFPYFGTLHVSKKTRRKINKIIDEDPYHKRLK